ncbi:radical SAM protein [Candidatus Pacearchaeota archaeon]|nr:radical SAM protein [Candidatus Pacearchaeota archaeon]
MVSIESKLRAANLFFRAALYARKKSLDEYGYMQRRSFLDSFIKLMERAEEKAEKAGFKTRMASNLLNYINPKQSFLFRKKFGFNPPTFFLINPTNACDKRCYGCYAGELNKKNSLSFEVMDKLLEEAKKAGIHFITISGGEPFFNSDTLKIFEKHRDITFLVFTHGQFIAGAYTEEFIKKNDLMQGEGLVRKLAELGNVHPAISQEGFEEETDARRGEGTYKHIKKARELLNKYGIAHGASLTVTRKNFKKITDKKLYEEIIRQHGCDFIWMFTYIPIGRKPSIELMLTPEQRLELAEFSINVRKEYEILVGDFRESAGDAQKGRCMIAGRGFFNVDGTGNIAPCTFVPYYTDNVNDLYTEFYVKSSKARLETLLQDAEKASEKAKKIILRAYQGLKDNWNSGLRIIPYALSRGMFVEMRLSQEELINDEHGKVHGSCVCSVLDHSKDVIRKNIEKWKGYSSDNQPSLTENKEVTEYLDKNAERQTKLAKTFRATYKNNPN